MGTSGIDIGRLAADFMAEERKEAVELRVLCADTASWSSSLWIECFESFLLNKPIIELSPAERLPLEKN